MVFILSAILLVCLLCAGHCSGGWGGDVKRQAWSLSQAAGCCLSNQTNMAPYYSFAFLCSLIILKTKGILWSKFSGLEPEDMQF